jgi:hypothetical protein
MLEFIRYFVNFNLFVSLRKKKNLYLLTRLILVQTQYTCGLYDGTIWASLREYNNLIKLINFLLKDHRETY